MDVTHIERLPGPDHAGADRRKLVRLASSSLTIWVRPQGRLRHRQAHAVDFNRHGLALLSGRRLQIDQTVYLRLQHAKFTRTSNVVGIVHNCVRHDDAYRCGIRFRMTSRRHREDAEIEMVLEQLEAVLTEAAG